MKANGIPTPRQDPPLAQRLHEARPPSYLGRLGLAGGQAAPIGDEPVDHLHMSGRVLDREVAFPSVESTATRGGQRGGQVMDPKLTQSYFWYGSP